jgi:hypothetical protein
LYFRDIFSRRLLAVALLALAPARASGQAPDSSSLRATRLGLDASYGRPEHSVFSGNTSVVPFVSEHWQVGLSPSWEVDGGARNYYLAGVADAIVNYVWLDDNGSGPYAGAFMSQRGASFAPGYGVYGLQAGWLRFLSPSVALRGELRLRRYSNAISSPSADLIVAFDPYLFGRGARHLTTLPSFGVFDATLLADYSMRPVHSLRINTTFAPFVTRWFQAGATANVQFAFFRSSGTHAFEVFGRGYLPVDTRVVPFADVFVSNASVGMSNSTVGSAGGRAGVRSYLTTGVALDLAVQWRRYDSELVGADIFTPAPERTLRATLTTQFRAVRARD